MADIQPTSTIKEFSALTETLRLHILPGKLSNKASDREIEAYKSVYQFWKSYWPPLIYNLDSNQISLEEFFRQDFVLALIDTSKNKVAAFLTLNQYNIKSDIFDHPYLQQYSSDFWARIKSIGIDSVWSGQYICVTEEYSAKKTRINLAAVILGLMHEVYRIHRTKSSALVSLARTDVASANTAKKFGWQSVGASINMHNVSVEQIALIGSPMLHKDESVNLHISNYWRGRIEYERTSNQYDKPERENLEIKETFAA